MTTQEWIVDHWTKDNKRWIADLQTIHLCWEPALVRPYVASQYAVWLSSPAACWAVDGVLPKHCAFFGHYTMSLMIGCCMTRLLVISHRHLLQQLLLGGVRCRPQPCLLHQQCFYSVAGQGHLRGFNDHDKNFVWTAWLLNKGRNDINPKDLLCGRLCGPSGLLQKFVNLCVYLKTLAQFLM